MLGLPGVLEWVVLALLLAPWAVLKCLAAWRIWEKTGQSGALGLLQLIPVVDLAMLLVLGYTRWPIERQLEESRGAGGGVGVSPGR